MANIVDAVRDNAGLTDKQIAWTMAKALSHAQQKMMRRGVRKVPTKPTQRNRFPCTCIHTMKHHTRSGHCRPGCDCQAGRTRRVIEG